MAISSRRNRQLLEAASPLLLQDEQVELTSPGAVGTVSVRKQAITAIVVAIVSLGTVMATVRPRPMYIVLTDRRVLLFDAPQGGKPGKLLINYPREHLSAGGSKKRLFGSTYVTFLTLAGEEHELKVVFPFKTRADGPRLVSALPVTR